ncbi:hypothetical protein D3C87_1394580 [compost metagenome]
MNSVGTCRQACPDRLVIVLNLSAESWKLVYLRLLSPPVDQLCQVTQIQRVPLGAFAE